MITLEKLTSELDVNKIDEVVVGGIFDFPWTFTTKNGTSGESGWTFTTDESIGMDPGQQEEYINMAFAIDPADVDLLSITHGGGGGPAG